MNLASELRQAPYLHRYSKRQRSEQTVPSTERVQAKSRRGHWTRHENLAFHVQVVIETGCRGYSRGKPEAPDFKKKCCAAHYESSQQN